MLINTQKEINNILLEVQSISGLPISYLKKNTPISNYLKVIRMFDVIVEEWKYIIIDNLLEYLYRKKRKRLNPNIKAYDW